MSFESVNRYTCNVCARVEEAPTNVYQNEPPPGWWFVQTTRDHRSYVVRTICVNCMTLLFARLLLPPEPPPPAPVPIVKEVIRYRYRIPKKRKASPKKPRG